MKNLILLLMLLMLFSCITQTNSPTAQEIIDRSIEVSGGKRYRQSEVAFVFRDRIYISQQQGNNKTLKRITFSDSQKITDVKTPNGFERYRNDSLVKVSDSLAFLYSNSINSTHYFSRLPYGLNDKAVNKKFLGEAQIKGKTYYKVQVTFDREGGGKDFEDVYLYWFDKQTYKPDYLAYKFQVDGGGIRFREAYNERYVDSVRFVDYKNYKADPKKIDFFKVDSIFSTEGLELLSKIELEQITVSINN